MKYNFKKPNNYAFEEAVESVTEGSGKGLLKIPGLNTVVLTRLFIMAGTLIPSILSAQDSTFTLQQAIERAKKNYPAIKAAQLEIEKQKALKATAYDFGNTSIYTGRDETGNDLPGTHNQIGIVQSDIDVFGIPAKSNLANARTQQAVSGLNLTESSLARDVRISWYRAVSTKQQWQFYRQLDSVYANFQKAAELRYKTQQTSRLEYLSASTKYKALMVNIKRAESNYLAALRILNQYLLYPAEFDVDVQGVGQNVFSALSTGDSLKGSPVLNYYSTLTVVAESSWKVQRANFFPKFDLGYVKQSVDGISGFYGWQVGISIPVLFFPQSGKNKAFKLNYQIAGQQYEQKRLEINAEYNQLISRYKILEDMLRYYRQEALPLADEQIQASNMAYRLGSIGYVQFIQNVETAIGIKQEFINQRAEYFELSARLKYLTGRQ